LEKVYEAIIDCDADAVAQRVRQAIDGRVDPLTVLEKMNVAIRAVGDKFGKGDVFITDLVGSAEAMNAGVRIIEPLILENRGRIATLGRVAMATAEGDIHDIGKNIVITLLRAAGFEVTNLGVDVPTVRIVETVTKEKFQVVGVSALLTPTVAAQERLIKRLSEIGIRDRIKVMVGGAAVTREWSKRIGSDGYAPDGLTTVQLVKQLTGVAQKK
jgi:corrinoid protein of di/trimethylamine methyltransferase